MTRRRRAVGHSPVSAGSAVIPSYVVGGKTVAQELPCSPVTWVESRDDADEFADSVYTAKGAQTLAIAVSLFCAGGIFGEATNIRLRKNGTTILDSATTTDPFGEVLTLSAETTVDVDDTITVTADGNGPGIGGAASNALSIVGTP
jgi:hypothetical protein